MAGNWVDTLRDRAAGLVPGFNPPDMPVEQAEKLEKVDKPYVTASEPGDFPELAPRDARARALHAKPATVPAAEAPAPKATPARKSTAAKKAR